MKKVLLLSISLLTLSGFGMSERALADICGNLNYEQCKKAAQAAIKAREPLSGQFVAAYTDRYNKLSWSKALPGTYSNGCVDANGQYDSSKCTFETLADGSRQVKVDDSNAAIACKKIGARLPTESEFESLIRNFDHLEKSYGPVLTDKGKAEMQGVFGDMNNWFWSSSVYPNYSYYAYDFFGYYGGVGLDFRDYYDFSAVRCVAGR